VRCITAPTHVVDVVWDEAMAHNTEELECGRSVEKFPQIVSVLLQ
jgi:hypothetical protein